MTMKLSDIESLVQLFGESDWGEMHLRYGDDDLFLSKDPAATGPATAAMPPASATVAPAAPSQPATPPGPTGGAATPVAAAAATAEVDRSGWVAVTAPNLGTFYRAPSPKAPPYVEVGDTVSEDTEICLVEVMKLFTTIQAGLSGTVREIVATDGKMVEFGEALMWIEPGA